METLRAWREGVAIKTTVGLLGRLVSEDNRALRTGLVEYRDVDKTPQGRSRVLHFEGGSCSGYRDISDNEANVFRKNEGFRHELEVRAVTYERRYPEHADAAAAFSLLDRGHRVIIPRGENIPVDLSRLIQQSGSRRASRHGLSLLFRRRLTPLASP